MSDATSEECAKTLEKWQTQWPLAMKGRSYLSPIKNDTSSSYRPAILQWGTLNMSSSTGLDSRRKEKSSTV
ncbi:hypothetical protein TKK_0010161 [Trichogramma kaykai]